MTIPIFQMEKLRTGQGKALVQAVAELSSCSLCALHCHDLPATLYLQGAVTGCPIFRVQLCFRCGDQGGAGRWGQE